MPLQLKNLKVEPEAFNLDKWDVNLTIKRSTLANEGERYTHLFSNRETALVTDIAMVELWLTLVECDIIGEDEKPLLRVGMSYNAFSEAMTSVWQYDPELFWAMHEKVRIVNKHWIPGDDSEGNAPTA